MSSLYIEELHAEGFGCLKSVDVKLTPLHAFIGPNDSGKSTLLQAVGAAVHFARGTFNRDENGRRRPFEPRWSDTYSFTLKFNQEDFIYRTEKNYYHTLENFSVNNETIFKNRIRDTPLFHDPKLESEYPQLINYFDRGARLLHLDPDALRAPSELIPDTDKARLWDESGRGLPAIYDSILSRGDDSFRTIVDEVRRLFPTVKNLQLKAVSPSTKVLAVELKSGERVPAQYLSDGLLYYLAFAAIRYVEPAAVLLVEEIENGLHPARIKEVMGIMRKISETTPETTQVLIATHSPLVINELEGHEVSVVRRTPDQGTQVTRMCDTANFEKRSKIYALGELWLSYANGVDESALIEGVQKP
jgi:predicted ATPase